MIPRYLWLAIASLAACAGGEGDGSAEATEDQIARLSTPEARVTDPDAAVRLQSLSVEDLEREGLMGAGCDFSAGGGILLASVGSEAIVRVGGTIRHLIPSGPVGPTGGFFEDRQLSVSVGRVGPSGVAADEGMRWPARITVTERRAEVQYRLEGFWSCGA